MVQTDLLGKLVSEWTTPILKGAGFRRAGLSFERENDEVVAVISYQRSLRQTGSERFTVNIGIGSKRLYAFEDRRTGKRTPVELCHWRTRLGRTRDVAADAWWELWDNEGADAVGREHQEVLQTHALPLLDRMASDEALCRDWSAGRSPGITELQRLMYLSVLLDGPETREQQRSVVEELKAFGSSKGLSGIVGVHLRQLGVA